MTDAMFLPHRRQVLASTALGFGHLALTSLLARTTAAIEASGSSLPGPHHRPRAQRMIFLFMKGGPSSVDTFDFKPQLQADDGKELPFAKPRVQFAPTGKLLASPWKFRPYGESGKLVSDLFPEVAKHVDRICFLHSVYGTNPAHGGALLKLHTGSDAFVRPSMGAWLSYGLGTENENLPAFVTITPTLAHGGVRNWGPAFLPAHHQGTPLGNASSKAIDAKVAYLRNSERSLAEQREQLELLEAMNREHQHSVGTDADLEARIRSFELAFRMQTEMPEIEDMADETEETLRMYGVDDPKTQEYGRKCLLARRFSERGVRFVQVTHSDPYVQWDQHAELRKGHSKNALEVDRPIAALLTDLERRGLLDETLVMWGGEFGRTPVAEAAGDGRDHNPEGFTVWLAGGGVKPGFSYGATDEYGYYSVEDRMHIHDLHATVLHLLGLDHERLTYRHAGRDFRLTDVAGKVAHAVMA